MNLYARAALLCAIFVLLLSSISCTADQKGVPKLEGRVTDVAKVLSPQDRAKLSQILAAYEQETRHQYAVLIVPTLSGESIESFSLRVVNSWGLGRKGVDNGILVTLAMKEQMTRIELGLGMERYISDQRCAAIIDEAMIPEFRRGEFTAGIEAGLVELMRAGRAFVVADPETKVRTVQ